MIWHPWPPIGLQNSGCNIWPWLIFQRSLSEQKEQATSTYTWRQQMICCHTLLQLGTTLILNQHNFISKKCPNWKLSILMYIIISKKGSMWLEEVIENGQDCQLTSSLSRCYAQPEDFRRSIKRARINRATASNMDPVNANLCRG